MDTTTVKKSFLRRLLNWRVILFLLAAGVTLVALLLVEENWRGERAWQNYKRAMQARGESFDPARLIPPTVPDGQNLATIPFLTTSNTDEGPMTGLENQFEWPDTPRHPPTWQFAMAGDLIGWAKAFHGPAADPAQAASTVLDYFQKREPVLAELESARSRPDCRFNMPYDGWATSRAGTVTLQQLSKIKQLVRLLSLRAQAELVLGRTDPALDDINLMFRFDDGLRHEPLIISQLVRMASLAILLQPVGEGLAEHRWSDAQLRVLQKHFSDAGVMDSVVRAFYGDRDIVMNPRLDAGNFNPKDWDAFPRGWARLEQLHINRAFDELVLPRIDPAQKIISPSVNHTLDLAAQRMTNASLFKIAVIRHTLFAGAMMPAIARTAEHTAYAENEMGMAALACALERYRLANGQYPENLDALVPKFISPLPRDVINGQPLKYRTTNDGRFVLYSVGWNEKDDGGTVALNQNKHPDQMQGDWVWEYPANN